MEPGRLLACAVVVVAWIATLWGSRPQKNVNERKGIHGFDPPEISSELVEREKISLFEIFPKIDPVSRIKVLKDELFAEELFEEAEPVVIENAAATSWPAMKQWNPEFFTKKIKEVKVHTSKHPTIRMHSSVHPMGKVSGILWHRPWDEAFISTSKFFSTSNEANKEYYYFFSKLKDMSRDIQGDVGEIRQLVARFRPTMEVNLWMGTKGISTPIHYDVAHNMYVQISGEKKFLLFPPYDHLNLYLYPRLHPSSRMSQVRTYDVLKDVYLNFSKVEPLEVTLRRNDILYIPPYWFHTTEVMDDHSISISVCSESQQVELRESIFLDQKISIPSEASITEKLSFLGAYISEIFRCKDEDSQDFDDENEAYAAANSKMKSFLLQIANSRFSKLEYDHEVENIISKIEASQKNFEEQIARSETSDNIEIITIGRNQGKEFMSRYDYVTGNSYRYTEDEWLIELANHVEDSIFWVFGDPFLAEPILRYLSSQ